MCLSYVMSQPVVCLSTPGMYPCKGCIWFQYLELKFQMISSKVHNAKKQFAVYGIAKSIWTCFKRDVATRINQYCVCVMYCHMNMSFWKTTLQKFFPPFCYTKYTLPSPQYNQECWGVLPFFNKEKNSHASCNLLKVLTSIVSESIKSRISI